MARKERKVVTILFADLAGFTSRAEELDPEDVDAILTAYHRRLRAELERFGGTVEKFIGDAVMAVFGAPVAHEDDPERAVRAALSIREWAAEEGDAVVRIAVHAGEAVVSLDARPEAGEGMVAGDVVNTAARLQTAAPDNGVLVGETTYNATRHTIDYREAGAVVAKGKAKEIPAWEAVQARSRFGVDVRQAGPAPLVGRQRERGLLLDTFERVVGERSPQLVTLVGVPGIGKSRLVYALFEALEQPGSEIVMWRQGRCLPYGDGVSFWAIGEIVKAHAGILDDDSTKVAEAKLAKTVRDVVDEEDARWVELFLRPLVGAETDVELGGDRRDEAFSAWRRFFEALADQRPLIVVIEDLHWADEGLLDFVDGLVDWANDIPLLVLCSARPELLERRPGWGGGKLNALTLALAPLSDDDSARLISGVLEQAVLPAETQQALLERAGGNPLYAEQYARLYLERGSVEDLPLPETVQGLIAARLDSLPADEKALLQEAAVMGKVFWSGGLSGNGLLRDRLHSLERKEFIRRERRSSVAGQDEFAFRHVLVRDVAYGQIPRATRAARHRAAAEWIEALGRPQDHAELLAHHYLSALELARAAGEETVELASRALVALREAGDRATTLNAFQAAAGFYAAALELAPDDPERPQLLFRLGRARVHAEEAGEDVLTDAVAALLEAADHETAVEAQLLLSLLAWRRGQRDEAFRHLDRATELAGEQSSPAKAAVLSATSRYLMLAGEDEEAIARGRETLVMAEQLGLDEIRAEALITIGTARHNRGDEGGIADLEESIAIAREINSTPALLRGYVNLTSCLAGAGRLADASRMGEEGLRLAERLGHGLSLRWFQGERSWTLYETGDWDMALAAAGAFIEEAELRPHYLEGLNRLVRALILLARDDVTGALDDTEKALTLAQDAKDPQTVYPALVSRSRVLIEAGDRSGADELFSELFAGDSRAEGMPFVAGALVALLALDLGREEELRRALPTLSASSRPVAELATATLDGHFVHAAEMLSGAGERPLAAEARLRAAKVLAKQGLRAEADEQLRQALTFYRSVGATRYVREAEALLAASA